MRTPKDFDFLAESIFEKLHQRISPTTLKRLWGYLHDTSSTPRQSTLDTLAPTIPPSPQGRAKRGVILPMKRFILPLFLLAISATSSYAQKIYKGNSPYTSDILCHIDQGKVYKGTSPYTSDILARFDGTGVYSGNSPYQSDIILTYRKGKIYKGRSPYESDVLATWRDSKMYSGTSPYQSDILFTYKDNKVYRKNEPYSSSVLLTTSARVHPIILYLILFTFGS